MTRTIIMAVEEREDRGRDRPALDVADGPSGPRPSWFRIPAREPVSSAMRDPTTPGKRVSSRKARESLGV